jgi:hypothetical protein
MKPTEANAKVAGAESSTRIANRCDLLGASNP